jgi:hypothetical protein
VGLDCEPWAESGPSILTESPWTIARAIIFAISHDDLFAIPPLLLIPGIADDHRNHNGLLAKPSSPISPEKKAKNKTLSSNQLFLGLYQSPRACHMNSVHGYMGTALVVSSPGISSELKGLIAPLSAKDLRDRVQYAAACLGIQAPSVQNQAARIQWLRERADLVLPYIRNYRQALLARVP